MIVLVDDAKPVRVTLAEILSGMLSGPNELMLAAQKKVKWLLGKKGASKIWFENGSVVMRTWVRARDRSDSFEFLKSVDPQTGELTLSYTGLCHLLMSRLRLTSLTLRSRIGSENGLTSLTRWIGSCREWTRITDTENSHH